MADLSGKRVAFIIHDIFEQVEFTGPRDALKDAGAETVLLSPNDGPVQGVNGDVEKADTFEIDQKLSDASPDDFDALVIPGGTINSDNLRINETAQSWLTTFLDAGKPTAVICHGPWLIVSSGRASGKRLTSYPTLRTDIENAGGLWVDETVVEDGNLITSRNPDDIPAFNEALISQLSEQA